MAEVRSARSERRVSRAVVVGALLLVAFGALTASAARASTIGPTNDWVRLSEGVKQGMLSGAFAARILHAGFEVTCDGHVYNVAGKDFDNGAVETGWLLGGNNSELFSSAYSMADRYGNLRQPLNQCYAQSFYDLVQAGSWHTVKYYVDPNSPGSKLGTLTPQGKVAQDIPKDRAQLALASRDPQGIGLPIDTALAAQLPEGTEVLKVTRRPNALGGGRGSSDLEPLIQRCHVMKHYNAGPEGLPGLIATDCDNKFDNRGALYFVSDPANPGDLIPVAMASRNIVSGENQPWSLQNTTIDIVIDANFFNFRQAVSLRDVAHVDGADPVAGAGGTDTRATEPNGAVCDLGASPTIVTPSCATPDGPAQEIQRAYEQVVAKFGGATPDLTSCFAQVKNHLYQCASVSAQLKACGAFESGQSSTARNAVYKVSHLVDAIDCFNSMAQCFASGPKTDVWLLKKDIDECGITNSAAEMETGKSEIYSKYGAIVSEFFHHFFDISNTAFSCWRGAGRAAELTARQIMTKNTCARVDPDFSQMDLTCVDEDIGNHVCNLQRNGGEFVEVPVVDGRADVGELSGTNPVLLSKECSASILGDGRTLVTAGHCLATTSSVQDATVLGSTGQQSTVVADCAPPIFTAAGRRDYGVCELRNAIANINPVYLVTYDPKLAADDCHPLAQSRSKYVITCGDGFFNGLGAGARVTMLAYPTSTEVNVWISKTHLARSVGTVSYVDMNQDLIYDDTMCTGGCSGAGYVVTRKGNQKLLVAVHGADDRYAGGGSIGSLIRSNEFLALETAALGPAGSVPPAVAPPAAPTKVKTEVIATQYRGSRVDPTQPLRLYRGPSSAGASIAVIASDPFSVAGYVEDASGGIWAYAKADSAAGFARGSEIQIRDFSSDRPLEDVIKETVSNAAAALERAKERSSLLDAALQDVRDHGAYGEYQCSPIPSGAEVYGAEVIWIEGRTLFDRIYTLYPANNSGVTTTTAKFFRRATADIGTLEVFRHADGTFIAHDDSNWNSLGFFDGAKFNHKFRMTTWAHSIGPCNTVTAGQLISGLEAELQSAQSEATEPNKSTFVVELGP